MKHFFFKEEKQGSKWVLTCKEPCFCHIAENHWTERD